MKILLAWRNHWFRAGPYIMNLNYSVLNDKVMKYSMTLLNSELKYVT